MKIVIETISHESHRYPTAGDWFTDPEGTVQIKVSKMSDWRYEMLVAVHEIVEMLYCKWKGIEQSDVDAFDMAYELNRKDGDTSEPGDNKEAPYYEAHQMANHVERLLSVILGVDWKVYEEEVDKL